MGWEDVRFEVNLSSLYRLIFIVALCAPFWFTVASRYAKRMHPGTTRASRTIARVLTSLFWGDITYSLLITCLLTTITYYPHQPVFDFVLLLASWPGVLVWWLLRVLLRFGGGTTGRANDALRQDTAGMREPGE